MLQIVGEYFLYTFLNHLVYVSYWLVHLILLTPYHGDRFEKLCFLIITRLVYFLLCNTCVTQTKMDLFLSQLIMKVNKQQQVLEQECKVLNDLLKLWPRKKDTTILEKTTELVRSEDANKNKANNLSWEEKQALLQVEKLLNKAQKAKTKAQLISQKDEHKQSMQSCDNVTEGIETEGLSNAALAIAIDTKKNYSIIRENQKIIHKDGCELRINKLTKNSTPSGKHGDIQKKHAVSRSAKTNVPVNTDMNICTQRNGYHPLSSQTSFRPSSSKQTVRPFSSKQTVGPSNSKQTVRPSSSKQTVRPSSSKHSHVPTHMSAPFKTDANIKFPKRRLNHLAGGKGKVRGGASSMKEQMPLPVINSRASDDVSKNNNVKPTDVDSVTDDNSALLNVPLDCSEYKENAHQRLSPCQLDLLVEHDAKEQCIENSNQNSSLQCNLPNALELSNSHESPYSIDKNSTTMPNDGSDIEDSSQQLFTLKQHGSSLKLPAKLKKLVALNNSLRERCLATRLVKKVLPGDAAQCFVDRLNAQEEICQELWTRLRALTCLRSHHILLAALENLDLDHLSENTPTEDLYKAKRTLEFVLSHFADLQEDADYLSTVHFRPLQHVYTSRENQPVATFINSQETGLQNNLAEYLCRSKKWAHLKFCEEYLQLQISLLKEMKIEWWNEIASENRDPSVLQAVYGLLTTCGQFLPALVTNPDGF